MNEVRNVDGKVVGNIVDGVLQKKVRRSKHFMRVLNGWGMDTDIFKHDFNEVKILDTENETLYVSKRDDWLTHGIRKNFGYGHQIILPLRFHEVRHKKQQSML